MPDFKRREKQALERELAVAERAGDKKWAASVRAALKEEFPEKPLDKLNKTELLAEAEAAGVEVDESMTKKQILESLEG